VSLPRVMPANLVKKAETLEKDFPGRMALLFSPGSLANPRRLPYSLDNGRFVTWSNNREWNGKDFIDHCDEALSRYRNPDWIVVPDVVANSAETFEWWKYWVPTMRRYNCSLAMAVQDGMTPDMVKKIRPAPDVIFIGGSTKWKWRSLRSWTANFPRVHVGRVNTYGLLWTAHKAGAESTDGTGWWHKIQHKQLVKYLKRSSLGLGETSVATFFPNL
jgi:hypothetical protein